MATITINKADLNRIRSKAGFPLADELILNAEEIKDYCIKPALEEYFRWFPKQATYTSDVDGTFAIDFPDTYTFGVVDARLSSSQNQIGTSVTGNRLLDIYVLSSYKNQSMGSAYGGSWGTKYNFGGMNRAREMSKQLRNMELAQKDNAKVRVTVEDRQVKGYTGYTSRLTIIWAKYSYDFDTDVKFERKEEVIELAQSYLLYNLADTVGLMVNTDLPIEIDASELKSEAEKLRENVITKWEEFPRIYVVPKGMGLSTW